MRIAIVSDVHANIEGLTAALRHAEGGGALDEVWCLGDIVGYGPEPGAVIAELRARHLTAVAGNHDRAATGLMDVDEFNPSAADAARWTAEQLTPDEHAFLAGLPLTCVTGDFTLAHGSLRNPVWEYLLEPEQADAQFARQGTPYSLVGHSHLPFWFEEQPGRGPKLWRAADGATVQLGDRRLVINPGSTGQPRDGDSRAAYALYDSAAGTVTWHRVEYDIAATQQKMRKARLDSWLIERLSVGR
jgi:diadenosine tetraphosphatase ApaH/serine/threonine PP2A family protein phosphatase